MNARATAATIDNVPVLQPAALTAPQKPNSKIVKAEPVKNPQLQLLSQSGILLHEERPRLIAATASILSLMVIAFIVWAGLTRVSEIAHAPGEIVPSGYAQTVQHVDGGIVTEILVHEQQLVQQGEVLMRLSGVSAERDYEEAEAALSAFKRRAATLSAFRDPNSLGQTYADESALLTLRAARKSERDVISQQLAQKGDEITALEADINSYQAQARVNQSELDGLNILREKGLVTVTRLHDAELRTLEARGALARSTAQLAAARKAVGEYRSRLAALNAKYEDQAAQELSELDGKIAQASSRVERLSEQVARLTIKAPVSGYVKGLQINTIGAVIAPGQTLFEIVPTEGDLAADIHVSTQDIGFVHVGQAVRLKVSAFDFARFGIFTGRITAISAATFTEGGPANPNPLNSQPGTKYYRARVTLDPAGTSEDGSDLQNAKLADLVPGMTLEGNIVLGQQSVLNYLLKPIHVAATSALTER